MKVSVCLASYNGEAFLLQQLSSILTDLEPNDEIILSDDASTDHTVAIARQVADDRLKINSFKNNVRHVRNFERALHFATGDIIFLSDQDDIWMSGKRDAIMSAFTQSPDVAMVVHALKLIDAEGRVIRPRSTVWMPKSTGRRPVVSYLLRQLVKNQITGCAIAFRRELLDILLPFPNAVYAHDHWISVAAPFAGKVLFVDQTLVEYRQHESNVTPRDGLSVTKQLKVRAKLGMLIAIAARRAALRWLKSRT